MPSNDERRDVAERLRGMCARGCNYKEEFYDLLVETVMDGWGFVEFSDVADRLADLIEPRERTCHIEHVDEDSFHLSCGHEADGYISPNYCPNCGAKVVDDHA